jgi:hypothetical protein
MKLNPTGARWHPKGGAARAFTLIEVILATAILFMCMFSILGLLASGIHAASILKQNGPTPGMIAAEMTMSNKLEAGFDSGAFEGIDAYRDYTWQRQIQLFSTNGLFQVDIVVFHNGEAASTLSMLLYRPDSGNPMRLR